MLSHFVAAAAGAVTGARVWATVAAVVGVLSLGLAIRARRAARSNPTAPHPRTVPAVLGLVAFVAGVVNLLVANGGPGTGNGVVAGAAAIVTGACALAVVAATRTRVAGTDEA